MDSSAPIERPLNPEEEAELTEALEGAFALLPPEDRSNCDLVVRAIGAFVDRKRDGRRKLSKTSAKELAPMLAALWAHQVKKALGWTWVHLSLAGGAEGLALVSRDRRYACFPIHDFFESLSNRKRVNTAVLRFNLIKGGVEVPAPPGSYTVLS